MTMPRVYYTPTNNSKVFINLRDIQNGELKKKERKR